MRALLIEWDARTGKRAGGINPKDKHLRCNGWQNLDVEPAIEIRLVEDDRDIIVCEGVTILEGESAINEAIEKHIPVKYKIEDMSLLLAHAGQKGISFDKFVGMNQIELAEYASKQGLAGVAERKPGRV